MEKQRTYIAIDLKSFYASVECVERGLNPLTTNLVVADATKTEKTICLAVSPSLKSYGIPGRARLFEVVQQVKNANYARRRKAPNRKFMEKSFDDTALKADSSLELDYIIAGPRMALYRDYSLRIMGIYLRYVARTDIKDYSIDEVFIDATDYLKMYKLSAHDFAKMLIKEVLNETGITATAGIGTNAYLCKVAMDIMAKRTKPDEDGVRIAELDEMSYRRQLWCHRPLTDFWRVGKGYASKLESVGIYTMGDIARCSLGKPNEYYNEDLLYKMFGVNAELLIDHAWGWEPVEFEHMRAYKPAANSISVGQVLTAPYIYEKTRIIIQEMADNLSLDLVDKGLVTDQIVLTIGYDIENLTDPKISRKYTGPITIDHYGRAVPKHAHGTINLPMQTSSTKLIVNATMELFEQIINKDLLSRRMTIAACRVVPEGDVTSDGKMEQLDLFTDYKALEEQRKKEKAELEKEKKRQQAVLEIKKKHGKNAILKGMNFQEGATTKERNEQIGGHKA